MLRRAKRSGRLPRATPVVDPLLPAYPCAGSWHVAQLVPAGSDRPVSKKILRPSSTRAAAEIGHGGIRRRNQRHPRGDGDRRRCDDGRGPLEREPDAR